MNVLLEFFAFFTLILVFGYLIPAGFFYWAYQLREFDGKERLRIQPRLPKPDGIRREITLSIGSVFIFAATAVAIFELYKAGRTNIYAHAKDYSLLYMPVSVLLCLIIHDTYFYWTHRLMHWPPVFKYVHLAHHRSVTPTPWAIFAFQPLEAVLQAIGMALIVIFLPLHPVALIVFLSLDTQMNTGGHTGFEFIPQSVSNSPVLKYLNTVTHHDSHHTNLRKNFGSFFNVWDRCMGTFLDAKTPPEVKPVEPMLTAKNTHAGRNVSGELEECRPVDR